MLVVFGLVGLILLSGCIPSTATATIEPSTSPTISPSPESTRPLSAPASLTPTATTIPPASTAAPSPTATRPSATPTAVALQTQHLTNVELGVGWAAPVGWHDVTAQMTGQQEGTLFRQVWANHEDAGQLLASPAVSLQETLMTLAIVVEEDPGLPFPPAGGLRRTTPLGQEVAAQTFEDEAAAPFDRRLSYTIARPPYWYVLELSCLFPAESDAVTRSALEAACQDAWERLSWSFGACALPAAPVALSGSWQAVSNAYYGYAFEVPAEWYKEEHRTPDQVDFLTDPVLLTQPRGCTVPNGVMELRFAASPWGNFLPADGPDRTGYEQLPDRAVPMWVRYQDEAETGYEGTTNTAIYIQGEEYWYSLGFQCRTPTGADAATQATFQAQCDAALRHILDSFQLQSTD